MTFIALNEIGFWSPRNVSEDSRIFWHCLMYYNGHYRVEPIYFDVSMDVTCDQTLPLTIRSLYKQQRRWAWGGENIPYLIFNAMKRWKNKDLDKGMIISHIVIQIYGFHAWATNALIIAVVGWMPMLLGGDRFNSTVLSGNLPMITQNLMNFAMVGLILSAIVSSLLLPKRPAQYSIWKNIKMILEWFLIPFVIVVFGAVPCLEAQIRLMFGKYMGFWVTPKSRN
jgi:cellulose synthase/poly-beta-1,6-N-acetylglucosamine synthase-like glycosyltransferase